jgi:N-glycosylase/DNA lyase
MNPRVRNLFSAYNAKRNEIKNRLAEFRQIAKKGPKRIFAELCFCLCTPQSKAVNCDKAVRRLKDRGLLFKGRPADVAACLKGLVRFHNNKAGYIVKARGAMKDRMDFSRGPKALRRWLVNNVKGLGLKEASHFLRNIGLGDELAIIDRHILANLKKYGAIDRIPQHISDKKYIELEEAMRKFSKRIKIPLAELDLLFWSNQTGHVFK